MFELVQMWALVEALGLVCLPLTVTVFHNLPDRGWAFSKALGMALLAFGVWLPLMVLHFLPYNRLFIACIALILLIGGLLGLARTRHVIAKVVRLNRLYVVAAEVVFLGMIFLLGWMRSYGPNIQSYEMFMDEGFISGIMRSPHLPPNDMWFAGYSINYYYYAHFMIATLAKLLAQSPSIAFNTGICIYFGLTAVCLFGVTCNVVAWARYQRKQVAANTVLERTDQAHPPLLNALPYGLLSMVMALVLGNLAATQQWWQNHGEDAHFDWFLPSRVIGKTINEFPAFSFLLSCFHAHVLTLAFTIMAMGLAFNLFLESDGKGLYVFGRGWRLPLTMGVTALVIGGLFTMNGWDYPTYMGLALVCIALQQWLVYQKRFEFALLLDIFSSTISLVALSFLLYIPFYLNFISPSQGIGLVAIADRSQLRDELLIYGLFAFFFISLLLVSSLKRPLFSLDEQQAHHEGHQLTGSIIGVALLVIDLLIFLLVPNSVTFVVMGSIAVLGLMLLFQHIDDRSHAFTLFLGVLAFALVAGCEIFFLKDVFANNYPRMNTVFKFYFQAWAQLSIASGCGLFFILDGFRSIKAPSVSLRWLQWSLKGLWGIFLAVLLLASTVYPLVAPRERFAQFDPATGSYFWQRSDSLDGLAYLQNYQQSLPGGAIYYGAGDYAALRWLNAHVPGDPSIIEAVGDDYSVYGRVSAFTGMPSPMGWLGHEYQWRVNWLNDEAHNIDLNRRGTDVDTIYTSSNPTLVLLLMARYHAQYLYVGQLERIKYPQANLGRFSAFMRVAYNANGVTIYKIK